MRFLFAGLTFVTLGCWDNSCHEWTGAACPGGVVPANCVTAPCTVDGSVVAHSTTTRLSPGQVLRVPITLPSSAYRLVTVYAHATTEAPAPTEGSIAVTLDGAAGVLSSSELTPAQTLRSWEFLVPPPSRTNTTLEIRFSGSALAPCEFSANVVDTAQKCTICDL